MKDRQKERRVLSVQSHVVHGVVGNKSATFPLQLLGFDVDAINAVQFSNHTGYAAWAGSRLGAADVAALADGLRANGLLRRVTHVLAGFLGAADVLAAVAAVAAELRGAGALVLVDPVLGDAGRLYVPQDMPAAYAAALLPLADVITPNAFEAALLAGGGQVSTAAAALAALDSLHALGPDCVVISSVELDSRPSTLTLFASHAKSKSKFCIEFPKFEGSFTGTGDLFAALLLARLGSSDTSTCKIDLPSLIYACEHAITTIHNVLNETVDYIKSLPPGTLVGGKADAQYRELRLIQSKKWIEESSVIFKAVMIEQ